MKKGPLNRRLRIERPTADESFTGAGSGTWAPVVEVWASVQDALPSRGERLAEGINVAARPAQVRMNYRQGIDSSMRALIGHYRLDEAEQLVWVGQDTLGLVALGARLPQRHHGVGTERERLLLGLAGGVPAEGVVHPPGPNARRADVQIQRSCICDLVGLIPWLGRLHLRVVQHNPDTMDRRANTTPSTMAPSERL